MSMAAEADDYQEPGDSTTGKSRGLQRFALDLHVHTPASHDWRGGDIEAADLVQEALNKGLDGIAITDHDTGEWIDRVRSAAAGTELTIFPGLELNNVAGNKGIHLIVLFPLDTSAGDVDRFLTKVGALSGVGERTVRTAPTVGLIQVLDAVVEFEAIAVLAHCASSKGALGDMRGALRTQVVRHPAVLAAEATAEDFHDGDKAGKRKRVYDLLDGTDPDYGRELAVYQASDNPAEEGHGHSLSGIGERFSYFYAEAPLALESLRQCFVDRDARIELPFNGATSPGPRAARVVRISVSSGFLDGLDVYLHEGLTTILGPKGSGKSLLIELLRFALDQQPTHPDIRRDHDLKLKSKLGLHGRVRVEVKTPEGGVLNFEREFDPAAENPFRDVSIPPVEAIRAHFLSQGEVIRIAESEDEQIRFIDSFFDFERFRDRMSEITIELGRLDATVAEQMRAWKLRGAETSRASQLRQQVADIEKKLKNPVFARQRALEAKSRALNGIREHLDALSTVLTNAHRALELVPVPPQADAAAGEDALLKELETLRSDARTTALTGVGEAIDRLAESQRVVSERLTTWSGQSSAESNKLSLEIAAQGGDLAVLNQQRARLASELANVEATVSAAQQTAELLAPTVKRRQELIQELSETQVEYTEARQEKCAWFEQKSGGQIKASVAAGANRDEFARSFLSMKRGSYLTDADVRTIAESVDPTTFVHSVLRFDLTRDANDLEPIVAASGLAAERIQSLATFMLDAESGPGYEALLRLQYANPPADRPSIEFRRDDGSYAPLSELSTGQKCTALLVMALCEDDRAIVVDQPEDSLDIRSIWEDMCVRLRESKRSRQFLFTTHNSSLAVASDTDMFLVLAATATHGEVVLDGAIDSERVRKEVITLLEGGQTTYFLKQRKYNIRDPYQRRRNST